MSKEHGDVNGNAIDWGVLLRLLHFNIVHITEWYDFENEMPNSFSIFILK